MNKEQIKIKFTETVHLNLCTKKHGFHLHRYLPNLQYNEIMKIIKYFVKYISVSRKVSV